VTADDIIKVKSGSAFTNGLDLLGGTFSGSGLRLPSDTPASWNDTGTKHTEFVSGSNEFRFIDNTINRASISFADGSYSVAGTQVVAAQGAAVSDASGGATVDTEARAAINALLARCRAHGIIAT